MKNIQKKPLFSLVQRGYTLVELIVVIAILALIMTLSIWAFQSNRDETRLDVAAEIVMSTIREAQNMSMSGVTQIDSDTGVVYVPEQGYGIIVYDIHRCSLQYLPHQWVVAVFKCSDEVVVLEKETGMPNYDATRDKHSRGWEVEKTDP